jgi:RHS repeat-associated protein
LVTDANGQVQQQVFYAPFGEVISESNAYWHNGQIPDYLFNAKELDEENGMYYYSARYYAPPVFTSRDPLFEKYFWCSPYAMTLNNPVKYVDPDGQRVIPTDRFNNSPYGNVYTKLSSNSVYQSITKSYSYSFTDHLYLDVDLSVTKTSYGITVYKIGGNGKLSVDATYYGSKQTEIGMVKTLLHEAIHAEDIINGIKSDPNHNGFDRQTLFEGLKEYNSTNKLGYSNDDLEILSWSGLQDSKEFNTYINNRASQNNRTPEVERNSFQKELINLIEE